MKMTYDQWMKDTGSMLHSRSAELKALDQAYKNYELAERNATGSILNEKKALQQALATWKKAQEAKGQRWQASVRNKLKAVEKLDAELGQLIVGAGGLNSRGEMTMDPEEARARKEIAAAIKQNTKQMFAGQKLTLRATKALADAGTVVSAMNTFRSSAKDIKNAVGGVPAPNLPQQVQSLLIKLFDNASAAEIQSALGPSFHDFLANVTPFVGCIKSGAQALVKWGSAAAGLYTRSKLGDAEDSFAPGDPAAAFEAILKIQTREIHQNVASASIYTAGAAAKGAFAAADFGALSGTLVGAVESLALLVQKIYLFARDWNEMKAANTLLASDQLDLQLFKTCPLLGCYLIGNSDTSAIINLAVGDYGRAGWKFEVEAMVKKAQPVFEKAREVVLGSRFELAGLSRMKGAVIDRNKKTLGLPTGKLDGVIQDVSDRIKKVVAS